eukprot:EG_transcript_6348
MEQPLPQTPSRKPPFALAGLHWFMAATLAAGLAVAVAVALVLRGTTCLFHDRRAIRGEVLGHLLRSMPAGPGAPVPVPPALRWLDGTEVFRVVPGHFPRGMDYHFDGLAMVLRFTFKDGQLHYTARHFDSPLYRHYDRCLYLGTGTGPTAGLQLCWQNPAVNLLPIAGQLWLTIDTAAWGRIDPDTLTTVAAATRVPSLVLNAHPACDPHTHECFVQFNCAALKAPYTDQACVARLVTSATDITAEVVQRVTLPYSMLIQHSHSLCLTPNYFVAKLDSFEQRRTCPDFKLSGMLQAVHQAERNIWLVMHRQTKETRVMYSGNHSFVNNHFWNCYEKDGAVVAEAVGATGDYLDAYFSGSLKRTPRWTDLLYPALRCRVPFAGDTVSCGPMLDDATVLFDYPTYNPALKMDPRYRWVYGVAVDHAQSRFYDSLIKVDVQRGRVHARWAPGDVYTAEGEFIARPGAADEDDGVLFSVGYNSTEDRSSVFILDARTLSVLATLPLDRVVPFHAHGIVCRGSPRRCTPNP